MEIANEELLISGKPATGVIFNLKNNFGWQDKQEEEQQQSNTVVNIVLDKPDDTDQP